MKNGIHSLISIWKMVVVCDCPRTRSNLQQMSYSTDLYTYFYEDVLNCLNRSTASDKWQKKIFVK